MHKFFAKTSFLGKKIVSLPECHSTNDELLRMARESDLMEGTVITTDHQLAGKGQRGNVWESEKGKNLLFSVYLKPVFVLPKDSFYLYIISALAAHDALQTFMTMDFAVKIKWPNDLMVYNKKIAGILIENNLKGSALEYSVVGMGLNVNQKESLPSTATSLMLESGMHAPVEQVLESYLLNLEKWYLSLKAGHLEEIKRKYEERMFWLGEDRFFRVEGQRWKGSILGIDDMGKLLVEIQGKTMTFGLKEISFLTEEV